MGKIASSRNVIAYDETDCYDRRSGFFYFLLLPTKESNKENSPLTAHSLELYG